MTPPAAVILVIEDDVSMRRFLRTALRAHAWRVIEAATAREGLAQAAGRNPDVILLDLGLPDGDGLELAPRLRRSARAPIIVISARGPGTGQGRRRSTSAPTTISPSRSACPSCWRGCGSRCATPARPAGAPEAPVFEAGQLRVDLVRRRVYRAGEEIHLTPTEYKLLATMIRHAGRVATHRQLLEEVWGTNYVGQTHYLRVYMAQLRHKLEPDPARPRLLATEPGVGYRLREG